MEQPYQSPGTVSRILWHFTGGPGWNAEECRQNASPKPAKQAYENLRSILRTAELRLGSYREVVHVRVTVRRFNKITRSHDTKPNVPKRLVSAPVCCLADVPIAHLSYLAPRYGKFAIGFHRESVVRHGFNPVFYALEDAASISSIYRGFTRLRDASFPEAVRLGVDFVREEMESFVAQHELTSQPDDDALDLLVAAANDIDRWATKTRESFEQFLGLVKTFTADQFSTIYCEREWRSLKAFGFAPTDIAMVVVPKAVGRNRYFLPFLQSLGRTNLLPRSVPVVPWEDLVEH